MVWSKLIMVTLFSIPGGGEVLDRTSCATTVSTSPSSSPAAAVSATTVGPTAAATTRSLLSRSEGPSFAVSAGDHKEQEELEIQETHKLVLVSNFYRQRTFVSGP